MLKSDLNSDIKKVKLKKNASFVFSHTPKIYIMLTHSDVKHLDGKLLAPEN